MIRIIWSKLFDEIFHSKKQKDLTDYWRNRAKRYGKHSVLNIAHREDEFDFVTDYQKQILFPILKSKLTGAECKALDFGCGPGRFTVGLAELIGGTVVGVDITHELIEIAPKSSLVSYQCIGTQSIPFPDGTFDLVWSCLVLGGIPDDEITNTINEISRVLKPGGLFFYVENTADAESSDYWFFRDEASYIRMAAFCKPQKLAEYEDMGQRITIFSGRKKLKYDKKN